MASIEKCLETYMVLAVWLNRGILTHIFVLPKHWLTNIRSKGFMKNKTF